MVGRFVGLLVGFPVGLVGVFVKILVGNGVGSLGSSNDRLRSRIVRRCKVFAPSFLCPW